jgi:hypothetical protein
MPAKVLASGLTCQPGACYLCRVDDLTITAIRAALALCDAVQASAQSERALLEHADRCRRASSQALRKHGDASDVWQGAR